MQPSTYPDLRDSNVPWIQSIPSHWTQKRLKFVVELVNQKQSVDQSDLPYIGLEHIESWTGRKIDGEISQSEGLASTYASGDVLFGKLRPYLAKIHLAGTPGLVSSEALVIRPSSDISSSFLKYYFLSRDFINTVDSSTYGSKMPRASWDYIGNLPLLIPSAQEQKAIVGFLDHKTAQIDALIAKKQSLLDKLAEQRTALISQAVTKGLDPSVPMKDSGVDWLGEIPAHWQCLPLRRLSHYVKTGTTPTGINELHFDDEGLPWYKPGDFTDGVFLESAGNKLSQEGVEAVRIFPSDTVMQVGIGATIGKVAIATSPASCNQQINCIHCNEKLHHLFAVYFLRAIRDFIVKCGKYTTLPIINQDETKSLPFTVPSYDEQVTISNYLLEAEKKSSRQSKKVLEIIERLQEYRSALITNAVTGKIDVRDFCPTATTEQKELAHG